MPIKDNVSIAAQPALEASEQPQHAEQPRVARLTQHDHMGQMILMSQQKIQQAEASLLLASVCEEVCACEQHWQAQCASTV